MSKTRANSRQFIAPLNLTLVITIIIFLSLFIGGCSLGNSQSSTGGAVTGGEAQSANSSAAILLDDGAQPVVLGNEATIGSVELVILETSPVQINAIVRGTVPDACTKVERVAQQRQGNILALNVTTARLVDARCDGQTALFEEGIHLDISGLPAGSYTVRANGANSVSTIFNLSAENAIPAEPLNPASATISGLVWADSCSLAEDGSPASGCVSGDDGGYHADGNYSESEARIAGALVTLKGGECPGNEIVQTVATNADGVYEFPNLSSGFHCVTIDAAVEPNFSVLLPGDWTSPAADNMVAGLTVEAGESKTADFGWAYRPGVASEGEVPCVDAAAYVEDVTIPDDTAVAPSEDFIKTWRIRNDGTCIWGPGYALIFDEGEQMGAPTTAHISEVVQPGDEVDLSISLVAPAVEGTYRSDWKIQNPDGETFGSLGDYAFYAQIVVSEVTNTW
ncbi:MAG: NBR1-Ig-like domain-containing protein [Anaerolineae bacterium]